MAARLDAGEVATNARVLWRSPGARVALAVLGAAVLLSGRVPGGAPPAAHEKRPSARPPPAGASARRAEECYALGYADAAAGRAFGSSTGVDDERHRDLLEQTLDELPPEAQGLRDEWARRQGVGRREDVRAGDAAGLTN